MQTTSDIQRTARVHWEGDIAKGRGQIDTESGLVSANYSFGTRFASEPGTNPEELLAASHAACFSMALSANLTRAGHAPTAIDTTARVTLHKEENGFKITGIRLETRATVPGVDQQAFDAAAKAAETGCPISQALKAVPIELDARLNP